MELWEGVHRTEASEREHSRVEELLEGLAEAPFDTGSPIRAGELNAVLSGRGQSIDVEDVVTGAIALERDEPVSTRNVEHFSRIDGLAVETY